MTRQVTSREWARQKARKTLKRRTSQEWKQAIDGLQCGRTCRLLAAQIVWWDFFSEKPARLHDDTQAKIIAAMLSDKPLTIFLGRKCGVTYAERIAKQIKAEMDKMQNHGADRTRHLVPGTVEPVVGTPNQKGEI